MLMRKLRRSRDVPTRDRPIPLIVDPMPVIVHQPLKLPPSVNPHGPLPMSNTQPLSPFSFFLSLIFFYRSLTGRSAPQPL